MLDVLTFDRAVMISASGTSALVLTRDQAQEVAGLLLKAIAAADAHQSGVVGHVGPARQNKPSSRAPAFLDPMRKLARVVRGPSEQGAVRA